MDLSVKSKENMGYMLEIIVKKLQFVNQGLIDQDSYSLDSYEDLYDLYRLVDKQNQFSVSEKEGILEELRSLRAS